MLLKQIGIDHIGAITTFQAEFTDSLNVVKWGDSDELFYAISAVLHNKSTPRIPKAWICQESKIHATVSIHEEVFFVTIQPESDLASVRLSARNEQAHDATAEYLYLSSHCEEHDLADTFQGNNRHTSLKFLRNLHETGMADQTLGGLGQIKAFHSYICHYIQNFRPERLREGKPYELVLERNGMYSIRHTENEKMRVYLSESEQLLFYYLCFLKTAEFWQGFEEIRNLHSIKKPVLIRNLLERLDESIDVTDLLNRTAKLNRQIIILPCRQGAV